MSRFLLSIMVVLLVVSMFIGCSSEGLNNDTSVNNGGHTSNDTGQNNDGENNDSQNTEDNNYPSETHNKIKFKDFFSTEKINNPQEFLNTIIPDFKLAMTIEYVNTNLGEPDKIVEQEIPTGEEVQWIYQNISGYQLTIKFIDDKMVNFELNKHFASEGLIPKIVNKIKPEEGSTLMYSELGFEGILLGSTINEVLNFYSEPRRAYLSNDEMYGYTLTMVYKGLVIQIPLEQDKLLVQHFNTNDLDKVATYRNISIGSSLDEVLKEYGQPKYDWWLEAGAIIYSANNDYSAIKFKFVDNKIISISVYNAL